MSLESITVKAVFNTSKEHVYNDWLSSEGHTAFTGGEAVASLNNGSPYTAWDGYIEGVNLELNENKRILNPGERWSLIQKT